MELQKKLENNSYQNKIDHLSGYGFKFKEDLSKILQKSPSNSIDKNLIENDFKLISNYIEDLTLYIEGLKNFREHEISYMISYINLRLNIEKKWKGSEIHIYWNDIEKFFRNKKNYI